MAKKKISTTQKLIKTPLSLKKMAISVIALAALIGFNVYVFRSDTNKVKKVATLTQNQLQNVLGASISIGLKQNITSPQDDKLTLYWKDVLRKRPNYPDAYIMLAIKSFNEHNCEGAQQNIQQALSLDPNNPTIPDLIKKMSTCFENKE